MNDIRDKMEQDILKQKQYYTYGLVQRVKTLGHELFPFSCRRNEEKKSFIKNLISKFRTPKKKF